MIRMMTGATITGVATLVLGLPGLVLGLILAFVYYGKTTKG